MYNIIITKYADNDYSICVTDDVEDIHSGCSVRGTLTEVLEELDADSLNVLKEIASIIKQEDAENENDAIWLRWTYQRSTESFG